MPLVAVHPYRKKTQLVFSSGSDPFFENVMSLCHFDVTGAPIDQISGNSWTLSTATVNNTRPKFGAMSLAIPNSKAYASNTNSQMVVGTADFTLEFFFYTLNSSGNYYCLYNDSSSNIFEIFGDTPSGLSLWFSGAHHYPGFSVTPNTWHHLAVVRQNGILYTFVDGVLGASTFSYTGEITNSGAFAIGSQLAGTAYATNGYIDEFRFTKYIARYTASNFTPTTVAFTDGRDDSTDPYMGSILFGMHCNGTVGTNPTTDWGTTVATNPAAQQPVIATGGKFGNCLNFAWKSLDYTTFLLNLDFTLEFWVNPVGSSAGTKRTLFSIGGSTANNLGFLIGINDSNRLELVLNSGAEPSSTSIASGTWYHVALTRRGNNFCAYVNGVSVITVSANPSAGSFAYLGRQVFSTSGYGYYNGLMDEIRLTQRVVRYGYGKSFAAPTAAFPDTFETGYDPYANQVVYNLPFDSNVNSTVKGYSGTQSGGQLSAGKFGKCFEKIASTDIVTLPSGSQNALTNKEFTIDGWFYNPGAPAVGSYIISCWRESGTTKAWSVYFDSANKLNFVYTTNGSTNVTLTTSSAPSINAWHHFAVVRHITLGFAIFIDGALATTFTASSNTIYSSTEPVVVGGTANNSYGAGLKLDDIRLTVGACRYTTPFIPPTSANKTA